MDLETRAERGLVPPDRSARLRQLRLRDLLIELARTGRELARKELELVRVEARQDLRSEAFMAGGLGVAGVCGVLVIQLLLVAAVLALMESGTLPGWEAALLLAALVLAVGTAAGLWGWARRVRKPLQSTRRSVRDGLRWIKERTA